MYILSSHNFELHFLFHVCIYIHVKCQIENKSHKLERTGLDSCKFKQSHLATPTRSEECRGNMSSGLLRCWVGQGRVQQIRPSSHLATSQPCALELILSLSFGFFICRIQTVMPAFQVTKKIKMR